MRRARLVVVALVVSVYVSLVTASQCDSVVEALLLESTQHTTHWGEWSAQIPAVAHVQSGDVVRVRSLTAVNGFREHKAAGVDVPAAMEAIFTAGCGVEAPGDRFPCGKIGPHLLTGPVAVAGAEVGDVLQVDVLDVDVMLPWGWNVVRPGAGSLKGFPYELLTIPLDLRRRSALLPWGGELPWNVTGTGPFFGGMGVSPPPHMGRVSSVSPWAEHGGNLDNKHFGKGCTLYFPVNVPGGMFSVGDGHAMQGDGEVCVTGLEASLEGLFRLTVRKDLGVAGAHNGTSWVPTGKTRPNQLRAETGTHYIAMAFDEDLNVAEVAALEDLLDWMELETPLNRMQLYRLASLAADMHVTQVVNTRKGIHVLFPKSALPHR